MYEFFGMPTYGFHICGYDFDYITIYFEDNWTLICSLCGTTIRVTDNLKEEVRLTAE